METDASGRYTVILEDFGDYEVRFRARKFLPAGSLTIQITQLNRTVDFDLPNTRVQFETSDGSWPAVPWQLHWYEIGSGLRGSSDLSGFVSPEDLRRPIVGLPVGKWRLFVDTIPDLVSAVPIEVDFESRPHQVAQVALVPGSASLRILTSSGNPISGATVIADSKRLSTDEDGVVSLRRVVPAAPLIVRADGFAPLCVLAPRVGETSTVQLQAGASNPAELTIGPETGWPLGFFQSRSDKCQVSAKMFRYAVLATSPTEVRVQVSGLRDEDYQFKPSVADVQWTKMRQDSSIVVHAPKGCKSCAANYQAKVTYNR